jgi:hypothetical protein
MLRALRSGVDFEKAWPRRIEADFSEGVRCGVIGLEDLPDNVPAPLALRYQIGWVRRLRSHRISATRILWRT